MNSSRGNKIYDDSDPEDRNYGLPAHNEAPLTSKDTDSWEPPSNIKGDIARSMFYMDIRYVGGDSGEQDLILTDDLGLVDSSASYMGKLSTLISWHFEDPVDDAERSRNHRVESFQGNRNPFVDVPEFVQLIYLEVERTPKLFISMESASVVVSWSALFTGSRRQEASGVSSEWLGISIQSSLIQGRWKAGISCQQSPVGSSGWKRYLLDSRQKPPSLQHNRGGLIHAMEGEQTRSGHLRTSGTLCRLLNPGWPIICNSSHHCWV